MTTLEKVNGIIGKLVTIVAYISCIFCLVMMLHIVIDVVLRNVFHIVVTGTYEITQYLYMPVIILAGLALTYRSGVLPHMDTFIEKGASGWKKGVQVWIFVIEAIIFFLLAFYSFKSASLAIADNRSFSAGGNQIPTWPAYLFCPIGFTLMLVDCIIERLCKLRKVFSNEPLTVQELKEKENLQEMMGSEQTTADTDEKNVKDEISKSN